MRHARTTGGLWLVLGLSAAICPHSALAQAWVPDKGDGTISYSVQYARVMKHLFSVDVSGFVDPATGYLQGPGNQGYYGDLTSVTQTFGAEHVPLKRLAVTAELFLMGSRYAGLSPESPYDDGDFHLDLQDIAVGARYQMPIQALALTPSLELRVPLTDYHTLGHTSAGNGLVALTAGLNMGRSLSPVLPLGYAFLNLAHQFAGDVDGHSLDRDLVTVGCGLFLTNSLSAQAHFTYQENAEGEDWWWSSASHAQHRTVANRETVRRIGASVGHSLTYRVGMALSAESTLSGANVHASHSVTLGLSWSYWDPKRIARRFGTAGTKGS